MANTSAIRQQAAHVTYKLQPPSCSARTMKNSLPLIEECQIIFWKKVKRMDR